MGCDDNCTEAALLRHAARRYRWWSAALALTSLAGATAADSPDSAAVPAGSKPLPQITIEAQRAALAHRLSTFVSGITRAAPHGESLRVWRSPICPAVAGLEHDQGEFVLERLSQIVRDAGAPLDGEHCQANLVIIVSAKPEEILKQWYGRHWNSFGGVPGTPAAFRRFLDHPRPVRVWYKDQFGAADPGPITTDSVQLGTRFSGGVINAPQIPSRLVYYDVAAFSSVIVIVDRKRAAGLQFGQLTDYIAMAALTELDLDAPLGTAPTILSLFAARSPEAQPPSGLSDWDRAFLKALYATRPKTVTQRMEIADQMLHFLAP